MKKTLFVKFYQKTQKLQLGHRGATVPHPYSDSLLFCNAKTVHFCVIWAQAFRGPGEAGRLGAPGGGTGGEVSQREAPKHYKNRHFFITASASSPK